MDEVIASDVRTSRRLLDSGPFAYCDVLDKVCMCVVRVSCVRALIGRALQ